MPIYEYRCNDCGHELEAIQKFSESPLTDCPACGQSSLKKLISAAGFQLKGNGWYATDFRNKGVNKSAKKDGESSDSAKSSDEQKSSPHGCGSGKCGCAA